MPVIEPPLVSKQLQDGIHKAELMHDFISATIPDKFVGDTDQKILIVAIYSLTSEHHGAILHLLKSGRFDGSALALVRPLIEGAYRAQWIHSCAKPDTVACIKKGENAYPGLINMATEIEKGLLPMECLSPLHLISMLFTATRTEVWSNLAVDLTQPEQPLNQTTATKRSWRP
jgi:hypothetical protein